MANSADPDQLASSEANWSGSTLFAKAGFIRAQQDKGFKMDVQVSKGKREKRFVFQFPKPWYSTAEPKFLGCLRLGSEPEILGCLGLG